MTTMELVEDYRPMLHVPASFQPQLTDVLAWVEEALNGSSARRREITRNEPLLFALVYFPELLRSEETDMEYSLAQMHIDMCEEATLWRYRHGPGEYRVAWVGPRESGKSTWEFVILPVWAMAHNWRKCCIMFSDTGDMAERHFRRIRRALDENELLREDYPELCEAAGRDIVLSVDNKSEYISRGGHAIAARGINKASLGFIEQRRPDMIVVDDVEPTGARYSAGQKAKRLQMLVEMIFPMNLNAVVTIVGTVTRFGSMMHEVAQAAANPDGTRADWIVEENIICRYYPAIVMDPLDMREHSFWPERWPYAWMEAVRQTRTFQLNYMNMPMSQGVGFWHITDYQYNFPFLIDQQVLAIDPAVKSKESNDYTGIAVMGFDQSKQNGVVQFAVGVRLDPNGTRDLIRNILQSNPKIRTIVIEDNNGGDYITNQLSPVIPRDIKVIQKFEQADKMLRIRELHDWYQMKWIWHNPGLHALEEQQLAYPDVDHDDIVDAVAKCAAHFLSERKLPRPMGMGQNERRRRIGRNLGG